MSLEKWLISLARPLVEPFPRIATLYRRVRDQLDYLEEPVLTPWGFKLAGNAAMARGEFEPTETELFRNMLEDIDVLVNVGANIGYYCCHALSLGKPIIAFEPIERNLRYLYKNIKANGWLDAEIYPIALSSKVGILEIYGGNTGASVVKGWANIPESYVTLVPCSTMDIVLGTRLRGKRALILVDVEGAEKWVLEGANTMLINEPRPIWVVEIMSAQHQPKGFNKNPHFKRTFQLFFENGYQCFIFDRSMRPIMISEVSVTPDGSQDFTAHNFIFSESKTGLPRAA